MAKRRESNQVNTIEKLAILTHEGFEDSREQLRAINGELRDIRSAIERLEERGAVQAGYAKEIYHLLFRVAAMEKQIAKLSK